jgi:hypothetical protein
VQAELLLAGEAPPIDVATLPDGTNS